MLFAVVIEQDFAVLFDQVRIIVDFNLLVHIKLVLAQIKAVLEFAALTPVVWGFAPPGRFVPDIFCELILIHVDFPN